MNEPRNITCIYANTPGFSGQRFAAEIMVSGLLERGWNVRVILTPTKNRLVDAPKSGRIFSSVRFVTQLFVAWCRSTWAAFTPRLLHISLGQTPFSMLREGLPLLIRSLFGIHRRKGVVTFNGHVFLSWKRNCLEARMLRFMARSVGYITILGPKQKQALIELGIPSHQVTVMDNSCLVTPVSDSECRAKQTIAAHESLRVLYLSSLIETKGYPDYVDAVSLLARDGTTKIDATLCGKISLDANSPRLPTHEAAENWLNGALAQINQSSCVRLTWVKGAQGEIKAELFRKAHIFVLPTRYRVEAQPISILEALASGCAVITAPIGEIPTMMRPESAILLPTPDGRSIFEAIHSLAVNADQRLAMALSGLRDFNDRFSHTRHIDQWEKLLLPLLARQSSRLPE